MERFVGKVAVVTGASAGIGAAIAEQLVNDGLKVVGLARRVERVEELSKKLQGKLGKLYARKTDLSNETDIKSALEWVQENVGDIHVLVNNAGLMKQANLLDISTKDIKTTFDTNVIAMTILCRDVTKKMIENKIDGHIININSVAGHVVVDFPGINVYCSTKFAVTALTETLRKELSRQASKIRVSSISPGYVKTEFQDELSEDFKKMLTTMPSLNSADIANAVAYTISSPAHVNITEMIIYPV